MSKSKNAGIFADRKELFIRLEYGPEFVTHWTGGPAYLDWDKVKMGESNLKQVINSFFTGFVFPVTKKLNRLFKKICGTKVGGVDRQIFSEFLEVAGQAISWVEKVRPFMDLYKEFPTNFLYTRVIHPVEELYMRCLIVTVMFGNRREKKKALRLLCHDFVHMGGINTDGKPGSVFENFLIWFRYCFDLFKEGPIHPAAYQAFGDIVESVAKQVKHDYPKVKPVFVGQVETFTKSTNCGFGRTDITSPAKTELLGRLDAVVKSLQAA
jgi:hypothetical protein